MQLALGSSLATRTYADPELAAAYEPGPRAVRAAGQRRADRAVASVGCRSSTSTGARSSSGPSSPSGSWPSPSQHDDDLLGRPRLGPTEPGPQLAGTSDQSPGRSPPGHSALPARAPPRARPAARDRPGGGRPRVRRMESTCSSATSTGASPTWSTPSTWPTPSASRSNGSRLTFLATGHSERGEAAETLRCAEEARRLAEEQGFSLLGRDGGVWEAAERVVTSGTTGPSTRSSRPGRWPPRPATRAGAPRCWVGWPRPPWPSATATSPDTRSPSPSGSRTGRANPGGTPPCTAWRPSGGWPRPPTGTSPRWPIPPIRGPGPRRPGWRRSRSPAGSGTRCTVPVPPPGTPACWTGSDGATRAGGWSPSGTTAVPEGLDTPVLTAVRARLVPSA